MTSGPSPGPGPNPIAGALGVTPSTADPTANGPTPNLVGANRNIDPATGLPLNIPPDVYGYTKGPDDTPAVGDLAQYADSQGHVDWQFMDSILGFDAYSAYYRFSRSAQESSQAEAVRTRHYRDLGEDIPASPITTMPKPDEWFHSSVSSMGTSGVMALIDAAYSLNRGHAMDPALRAEIEAGIQAAPLVARQQLLGNVLASKQYNPLGGGLSGASAASGIASNPFINKIITDYETLHPNPADVAKDAELTAAKQKKAAADKFIATYTSIFGHPPSAEDIAKVPGMTQDQYNDFINNTTYQYGIKYGDWQHSSKALGPIWYGAFGKDPGNNEIAHAAGMTPEQMKEWINGMPSTRVKGLTVGEFSGQKDALSNVMRTEFGHDAPDELIHLFNWGDKK